MPCLAVGGGITPEGVAALAKVGAVTMPMTDRPMTLQKAMSDAAILVAGAGERLARVVEVGTVVGERKTARVAEPAK